MASFPWWRWRNLCCHSLSHRMGWRVCCHQGSAGPGSLTQTHGPFPRATMSLLSGGLAHAPPTAPGTTSCSLPTLPGCPSYLSVNQSGLSPGPCTWKASATWAGTPVLSHDRDRNHVSSCSVPLNPDTLLCRVVSETTVRADVVSSGWWSHRHVRWFWQQVTTRQLKQRARHGLLERGRPSEGHRSLPMGSRLPSPKAGRLSLDCGSFPAV